ncbi:MAG: hypothetical protein HEQ35_00090 [Gloeotrichia echinulata IR180]
MLEFLQNLFDNLPPLNERKNPQIAAAMGFFFGALGLGIYFLSFIDFILSAAIWLALLWLVFSVIEDFFTLAFIAGIVLAIYGYIRAERSNYQLKNK